MFKIFIAKTELHYIDRLPASFQAFFYHSLDVVLDGGLTALPPGYTTIDNEKRIYRTVLTTEWLADREVSSLIVEGWFDHDEAGDTHYYFEHAEALVEGGAIDHFEKDSVKEDYKEITRDFVANKKGSKLVKKCWQNLKERAAYFLPYLRTKQNFYPDLKAIHEFRIHRERYGALTAKPFDQPGIREVHNLTITQSKGNSNSQRLHAIIDKAKNKYTHPFIVLNFLDALDAYHQAQIEFFEILIANLSGYSPDTDMIIINVPIRDEKGQRYYCDDYASYQKSTPPSWGMTNDEIRPFSVVLFGPQNTLALSRKALSFSKPKFESLYIDLFQKCRCEKITDEQRDVLFQTNLDLIIHELFAAAGSMLSEIGVITLDYKGSGQENIEIKCGAFADQTVVIRVNDDNENQWKEVIHACAYLQISGFPYVIIVKAEGVNNVEIYSKTVCLKLEFALREAVQMLYRQNILNNLPGNQTVNNLYAGYDLEIKRRKVRGYSPSLTISRNYR